MPKTQAGLISVRQPSGQVSVEPPGEDKVNGENTVSELNYNMYGTRDATPT